MDPEHVTSYIMAMCDKHIQSLVTLEADGQVETDDTWADAMNMVEAELHATAKGEKLDDKGLTISDVHTIGGRSSRTSSSIR